MPTLRPRHRRRLIQASPVKKKRGERGAPTTLLTLSDDTLRRALAHVPLQSHGALAQTCKRLKDVKERRQFRRERANSGCEESVLIVTGGNDARDDTWNETTFVLQADGSWRTRPQQNPNPLLRLPRAVQEMDLVSGNGGGHAVVNGELFVVGAVSLCGLPSASLSAYDVGGDAWRDSYAHARRSRRNATPCPPPPEARAAAAVGAIGDLLVVAGGESDEAVVVPDEDEDGFLACNLEIVARCQAFDTRTREWTRIEEMPLGVAHAASAVVGGKLYVAGGVFTDGLADGLEDESDQLQVFDSVGWTSERIDLPGDRSSSRFPGSTCGVARDGEFVVVCGGSREHEIVEEEDEPVFELVEAAPRTYAYDVRARSWRALPALPELREGSSVAAHGGDLYVVGGISPSDRAPPLVLRAGATAWAPAPGAPDELGALERPALASVVLG